MNEQIAMENCTRMRDGMERIKEISLRIMLDFHSPGEGNVELFRNCFLSHQCQIVEHFFVRQTTVRLSSNFIESNFVIFREIPFHKATDLKSMVLRIPSILILQSCCDFLFFFLLLRLFHFHGICQHLDTMTTERATEGGGATDRRIFK